MNHTQLSRQHQTHGVTHYSLQGSTTTSEHNMDIYYKFYHTCGHTGEGPRKSNTSPETQITNPLSATKTVRVSLPFKCPFCCILTLLVEGGEGVLVILTPASSPFPNMWHIIRACIYENVKPEEWALAHVAGGHMAWIPKPCGVVDFTEDGEERTEGDHVEHELTTHISCSWKQRRGEPVRSRFAGLLSQMDAALSSSEHGRRE